MPDIGVIAGSGLYGMPGLRALREVWAETPYGNPSSPITIGELSGVEVAFLARHGSPHRIPPAMVNYRANIRGLWDLGVRRIISINATGGIKETLIPGDLVVTDQVIDMTQGARPGTFYDAEDVVHVDFTDPYCPELRGAVLGAGAESGVALIDGGTYVCVNGPRLESRAEISFFSSSGADVVGMTGMPEAALARELEICLCSVSVVTNYAAGIKEARLTTSEVVGVMGEATEKLQVLLAAAVKRVPTSRACACKDALKDSRL